MSKRLIFILMFFFALSIPLASNYIFAVDPTPFGPGPVVPPGGEGGGTGTTIPVQTPQAGKALSGWNGTSFDTVTIPTPAPTVPASTPVAGQAVTGFGAGLGSVSRESFQAPMPTPTPTTNYVLRGWDGANWIASQLDYSEVASTPTLGTMAGLNSADFVDALSQAGAPGAGAGISAKELVFDVTDPASPVVYACGGAGESCVNIAAQGDGITELNDGTNAVVASGATAVKLVGSSVLTITCNNSTTPKQCAWALDILGLTEDTTPGSDYELVGQKISDSTYVKIPSSALGSTPTASVVTCRPMRLDTVDTQNSSTGINALHLTNGFDETVVYYTDNVAAASTYWTFVVPADVAAAPAWYLQTISRSAGTGTDLYLDISCAAIATTEAADATPTVILAEGTSGVTVIGTGANNTLNTFNCGSNCDSTLTIAANDELKCKFTRTSNNAADTVGAAWYLKDVEVCYATKIN